MEQNNRVIGEYKTTITRVDIEELEVKTGCHGNTHITCKGSFLLRNKSSDLLSIKGISYLPIYDFLTAWEYFVSQYLTFQTWCYNSSRQNILKQVSDRHTSNLHILQIYIVMKSPDLIVHVL